MNICKDIMVIVKFGPMCKVFFTKNNIWTSLLVISMCSKRLDQVCIDNILTILVFVDNIG